MRSVVVDGAYDHAARPGSHSGQRRALEFPGPIARLHVHHFTVLPLRDPDGKDVQLAEFANRRNAAEIESGVARAPLDAVWEVGKQVGSGWRPVGPLGGTHILQERLPLHSA